MCKVFKVPADHEIFENINFAQWMWYLCNVQKDEEEQFEKERNLLEYLASFENPEAVKQVRKAREETVKVEDKEFDKVLKNLFGKELPKDYKQPQKGNSVIHTVKNLPKGVFKKQEKVIEPMFNYKHWGNLKLE